MPLTLMCGDVNAVRYAQSLAIACLGLHRGAGEAEAFGLRAAAADMSPRQLRGHLTFPQSWGPTEWGPISFLPEHDILVSLLASGRPPSSKSDCISAPSFLRLAQAAWDAEHYARADLSGLSLMYEACAAHRCEIWSASGETWTSIGASVQAQRVKHLCLAPQAPRTAC